MKFTKWHGLGNDFIIVEPNKNPGVNLPGMARRLCDRHFGIGADGVVTVRPLGGNSFEMRIYNADGTECEMCGNATRCVGVYIHRNRLAPGVEFELHTRAGIIRPRVLENNSVRVDMGEPRVIHREITIDGSRRFTGAALSMGNPHMVIFVDKIGDIQLEKWGAELETAPQFPQKTNVEFVEVLSRHMVRMRVWERGCGVTLACGTGSCATAVAGVLNGRLERNVSVLLDGGELQIEYSETDNHVYMTGPATEVYAGEYLERC